MAFRAGSEIVVVVGVDLLGFPAVLGNRARTLVRRLPPENIIIRSTHTRRT